MLTHYQNQLLISSKNKNNISEEHYILARQAIYFYLKENNITKVYLPEYCAFGAYIPYKTLDITICYYCLDENLNIQLPKDFEYDDRTVFHYIHHFGLYNKNNIEILIDLNKKNLKIIDDRSLTLPKKPYEYRFDTEIYSIYKLSGLHCGAIRIDRDKTNNNNNNNIISSSNLINKLKFWKKLNNLNIINIFGKKTFLLYSKLFLNRFNPNSYINDVWHTDYCITEELDEQLHNLDYNYISTSQIENAKILFENINPAKLFTMQKEQYCSQALVGFPIKTNYPKELQNQLMREGVIGFSLINGWLFDKENNQIKNHYCLPCQAGLAPKKLIKMANIINKL